MKDFPLAGTVAPTLDNFAAVGGTVFFTVGRSRFGGPSELWATDGTAAGTPSGPRLRARPVRLHERATAGPLRRPSLLRRPAPGRDSTLDDRRHDHGAGRRRGVQPERVSPRPYRCRRPPVLRGLRPGQPDEALADRRDRRRDRDRRRRRAGRRGGGPDRRRRRRVLLRHDRPDRNRPATCTRSTGPPPRSSGPGSPTPATAARGRPRRPIVLRGGRRLDRVPDPAMGDGRHAGRNGRAEPGSRRAVRS